MRCMLRCAVGRLRGAAIDVFPGGARVCGPYLRICPCARLDNVILTPHVGALHRGGAAQPRHRGYGERQRDFLLLGAVRGSVNLPEWRRRAARAARWCTCTGTSRA
jgi:phosphoglycerate dehydrogenase-like enzyme